MPIDREALRRKLQESFFIEAKERLQAIDDVHAEWMKRSITTQSVESLFREVHSLKGAARAAGLHQQEALCHDWENLLAHARHNPDILTDEKVSWSLQQYQQLQALCEALVEGAPEPSNKVAMHSTSTPEPATMPRGTVRVSQQQLDELLHSTNAMKQLQQQLHSLRHKMQSQLRLRDIDKQRHQRSDTLIQQLHTLLPQFSSHQQSLVRELLSYADWAQVQFRQNHEWVVEQGREL